MHLILPAAHSLVNILNILSLILSLFKGSYNALDVLRLMFDFTILTTYFC